MGNTGLGKHKDVHNSDSTLEFETGKKMFPSEQEAKMILSGECHVIPCMIRVSIHTHPKGWSLKFLGGVI